MDRILKRQRGFSLIEVLAALVLLSIGLLAIAGLLVASVQGNIFSHNLMQATYVAQGRLEFLKNVSFDSLQLQAGNHSDGALAISGVIFNRSYTVTVDGNLKNLTYTVIWVDGINHRISFSTIRSQ